MWREGLELSYADGFRERLLGVDASGRRRYEVTRPDGTRTGFVSGGGACDW